MKYYVSSIQKDVEKVRQEEAKKREQGFPITLSSDSAKLSSEGTMQDVDAMRIKTLEHNLKKANKENDKLKSRLAAIESKSCTEKIYDALDIEWTRIANIARTMIPTARLDEGGDDDDDEDDEDDEDDDDDDDDDDNDDDDVAKKKKGAIDDVAVLTRFSSQGTESARKKASDHMTACLEDSLRNGLIRGWISVKDAEEREKLHWCSTVASAFTEGARDLWQDSMDILAKKDKIYVCSYEGFALDPRDYARIMPQLKKSCKIIFVDSFGNVRKPLTPAYLLKCFTDVDFFRRLPTDSVPYMIECAEKDRFLKQMSWAVQSLVHGGGRQSSRRQRSGYSNFVYEDMEEIRNPWKKRTVKDQRVIDRAKLDALVLANAKRNGKKLPSDRRRQQASASSSKSINQHV